jgi:hypothetical protein
MNAREIDWSKAPAGATHFGPESEEWIEVWYKLDGGKWFAMITSNDDQWDYSPSVDEDRVSQMIQRPSAWNGTGLPPVGTVCEGRGRLDGEWREVVVLAHRIGRAVVSFTDHERLQWCESDELRPIRTPEQVAAEEREKAIHEMAKIVGWTPTNIDSCAKLYDAGYRKVAEARE